jgi:glycosyltransferase involved in cell wall biosynthesis
MITLVIFKSNTRGMRYGIGTYIDQLIKSLSEFPDVKIILINYYDSNCLEFRPPDKKTKIINIYFPSPRIYRGVVAQREKYALRMIDLLETSVLKSSKAIFLVNYPDALPLVKKLKSKFSFPIISIIHSAQWQFVFEGNKQKFIESWDNQADNQIPEIKQILEEKELYDLSDKIISVTDYMKDFLIKYYKMAEEKIEIIHNGIDNKLFRIPNRKEKLELKTELGLRRDEKIILFSGRLDPSKGIFFLLDAFAVVVKKYEKVRLILAGDDSGDERISKYLTHCTNIWGKVSFTGFVNYEQILRFYQIADIGIIPSVYDHGTYVALEMIGHHIPLIVSNAEGFDEFLTERQCIFLHQVIDSVGNVSFNKYEIADAILLLLTDEGKVNQITKDYPEMIKNRLSANRMAQEYYSLLQKISCGD